MQPYGMKPIEALEDPTIHKGWYNGRCDDRSRQAKATNHRRKSQARQAGKNQAHAEHVDMLKEVAE